MPQWPTHDRSEQDTPFYLVEPNSNVYRVLILFWIASLAKDDVFKSFSYFDDRGFLYRSVETQKQRQQIFVLSIYPCWGLSLASADSEMTNKAEARNIARPSSQRLSRVCDFFVCV